MRRTKCLAQRTLAILGFVACSRASAFCPQALSSAPHATLASAQRTALHGGVADDQHMGTEPQESSSNSSDETVKGKTRIDLRSIEDDNMFDEFLQEDGRICVIRVYAHWCKSCQKVGLQLRRLGGEHGDLISVDERNEVVREGSVRFGELEYGQNLLLCQSFGILKLPTVMIFWRGDMLDCFPCGPKKIPLLVEKLDRLLALSDDELRLEAKMREGNELGDYLLDQISSELSRQKSQHPELNQDEASSDSSDTQRKFGVF
eukprot:CAMPEP_0198133602 /NCGR_PEP_ID=MMETSP1442-20131203/59649_1 /TAXON_ID= /ORGANISM="Craspedostauros australis, Strain CCMP3328" /LENGTH=260 /DNA_ID=CAMNT_0043794727 /DNA_START=753 /DNA_END=1535 /DNA_ORIENTATION=+